MQEQVLGQKHFKLIFSLDQSSGVEGRRQERIGARQIFSILGLDIILYYLQLFTVSPQRAGAGQKQQYFPRCQKWTNRKAAMTNLYNLARWS